MKHFIKKEIPARFVERHSHSVCDLCGALSDCADDWATETYNEQTVEINFKNAYNYPFDGHSESIEFDICPSCFMSKLVPWFQSQGVEPRKLESDW